MKQETLEEVASRLLYNKYPYHPPQDSGYLKDMFIEGAKWQQERMCSEVFEWLSSKNYLSDKVYIIKKEFEQFKNKQL